MKEFYSKNKKILNNFFIFFLIILSFGVFNICWAGAIDKVVVTVVGWIASLFILICGLILTVVIKAIIIITNYNNFINEQSISEAWKIVRDLANMFFILVLLIIAFATILRIENYNVKKMLPKLLIMAVLVNFSKMICGIFIDFSQIIMATFVKAFSDGGGNFVNLLRVDEYVKVAKNSATWTDSTNQLNLTNTVAAMIIAVLFLIIATITMLAILVVFVMRVIMLWIYVILSPLAFLLSTFPGGQKYSAQYWGDFTKYLVNGPILAFFIWLSLITIQRSGEFSNLAFLNSSDTLILPDTNALTQMLTDKSFMSFLIAIGLLVGGLMVSSQIGGIGASWGTGAVKGLQSRASGMLKRGASEIGRGAKDLTFTAGRNLDIAQMKLQKRIFGKEGVKYYAKSLNYRQIKKGWDASRAQALQKYETGEETGGPVSGAWHDIVNRYTSIDQYRAIKKSTGNITRDKEEAARLRFNAGRSGERIENTGLDDEDKKLNKEKYKSERTQMLASYIKNAPPEFTTEEEKKKYANEQYHYDMVSLDEPEKLDKEKDKKIIEENEKQASILEDPRATIFGRKWGSEKAAKRAGIGYVFSERGAEEQYDSAMSELRRSTGDESGAIVEEVIKSFEKGETSKVVGGFRLLAQNNDINESLKDRRMISLMTKSNGLLEKLAKSKTVNGLNESNVGALKDDFRSNPVTAANAQAMIQSMFSELGLNKSMGAKIAAGIGEIGIQKGNSITYAMGKADQTTGGHTYDEMTFKDGRLHASDERRMAGASKLKTFESQAWARNLHPDSWFAEDVNGAAAYLTDEGETLLRNITAHQLEQMRRLRPDNFKAASNPKLLRQIKSLAVEVAKEGDTQQADLIKYFGGFIKTKLKSGKLDSLEEMKKALDEDQNV